LSDRIGSVEFTQDRIKWFSVQDQVFQTGLDEWLIQDRISGFSVQYRIRLSEDKKKMKLTDIGFHLEITSDIG